MIANIEFIKDVIDWLYGVNSNDAAIVTKEIIYNIDQISNVSARFAIVFQIFRYYSFECSRPLPDELKIIFEKYLNLRL